MVFIVTLYRERRNVMRYIERVINASHRFWRMYHIHIIAELCANKISYFEGGLTLYIRGSSPASNRYQGMQREMPIGRDRLARRTRKVRWSGYPQKEEASGSVGDSC